MKKGWEVENCILELLRLVHPLIKSENPITLDQLHLRSIFKMEKHNFFPMGKKNYNELFWMSQCIFLWV